MLTAGTALFVAAEFSLTALERSTVDANARTGGRRDKLVQRAHRTLSFQLSGAQVGISITTLITGYLAEPLVAHLLEPVFTATVAAPVASPSGLALALALLIATSVSMVFGELVAQYLAVAKPLPTARAVAGPQVLFSMLFTPLINVTNGTANWILRRLGIEPAEELRSARSPQELGSLVRNSARRGVAGPGHRDAGGPLAAVRRAHRRGADDAALRDRGAARSTTPSPIWSTRRSRPATRASRSSTATSTRPSASCTSSRSSRCRRRTRSNTRLATLAQPVPRCRRPWTATP